MDSGIDHQQQANRATGNAKPLHLAKLFLEGPGSPGRRRLERLIAGKFDRVHDAHITEFLPHLVGLGANDRVHAIAGLRLAGKNPLFLEQYIERPIEQAISQAYRTPVDRSQVVEIGNLVSMQAGAATALFALLPAILHGAGIRWVACSATPTVRALLSGLDFPSQQIAEADPGALVSGAGNWGRYYSTRPIVIAGNVQAALRNAQKIMSLGFLDYDQARQLSDTANALRIARA